MNPSETGGATGAKRLLELFAIIAFYLYFGGWIYANDLLASFGINIASVTPQTNYFVVYAYSVFFRSVLGWLLLFGIAGGWYALVRLRFVWWAELLAAALIATVPFPAIRWLAAERATHDAAALRGGNAKLVTLVARPDMTTKYPAELVKQLGSGSLFLVLATEDRYWVVSQPQGQDDSELPVATLYDVPAGDFLVKIELQNTRRPK